MSDRVHFQIRAGTTGEQASSRIPSRMVKLMRTPLALPDGRWAILYGRHRPVTHDYGSGDGVNGEYARRWNPLRREWVLIAAARQDRTLLPEVAACPLCPSRPGYFSEIPATEFQLAVFENRFPAMKPRAGSCEVVVYTQEHSGSLAGLDDQRIGQLVDVWADRYVELGSRKEIAYVFIFENRGEPTGVTLHHPHGQIYAFPFVPPVPQAELRASRAHLRRHGECLHCSLIAAERKAPERLLFQGDGIAAYVPAYARWPFEVHVAPIAHHAALTDLSQKRRTALGFALRRVARGYDRLFNVPMPYMMVMHQRPTDGRAHPEAHLHVEFYPVLRSPGRLKFVAGGECGAGTFVSDGLPEEKAADLRRVI